MLNETFDNELLELKNKDLARSITLSKQNIVNLSSNDYLGLSHHPKVIEAVKAAVDKWGTGGASSRLLAGTNELHRGLENDLASFLGKEGALVFSSGYHVNTGILPALAGPGDLIVFDRLCHASLIDGIRLSRAAFAAFQHNKMDDLENILKKRGKGRRRLWIVTEGFFSMDGDAPPIKEIVRVASHWGAATYIDEAHSLGVAGPEGKGWAAREGVLDKIDVFVGTLSKTLGSQGGFVAGSRVLLDLLISKCRSFIYTTALAPVCAAAARESLKVLPQLEDRRFKIIQAASGLKRGLEHLGYDCFSSCSAIVPVRTGSIQETKKLSEYLFNHGFFVPSIRPPTVPAGEGRVRLSITYENGANNVEKIIQAFAGYENRPSITGEKIVSKN